MPINITRYRPIEKGDTIMSAQSDASPAIALEQMCVSELARNGRISSVNPTHIETERGVLNHTYRTTFKGTQEDMAQLVLAARVTEFSQTLPLGAKAIGQPMEEFLARFRDVLPAHLREQATPTLLYLKPLGMSGLLVTSGFTSAEEVYTIQHLSIEKLLGTLCMVAEGQSLLEAANMAHNFYSDTLMRLLAIARRQQATLSDAVKCARGRVVINDIEHTLEYARETGEPLDEVIQQMRKPPPTVLY